MVTTKNKLFGIILFLITLTSINTGFALTPEEILQMDKDAYAAEIAVPTENARRAAKMATTILHNKMIAPADKQDAIQGHIDTAQDQANRVNNISLKTDYANVPQATKDETRDRIKVFVDKAKNCLDEAKGLEVSMPQKAAERALRRQLIVAKKQAFVALAIKGLQSQASVDRLNRLFRDEKFYITSIKDTSNLIGYYATVTIQCGDDGKRAIATFNNFDLYHTKLEVQVDKITPLPSDSNVHQPKTPAQQPTTGKSVRLKISGLNDLVALNSLRALFENKGFYVTNIEDTSGITGYYATVTIQCDDNGSRAIATLNNYALNGMNLEIINQ